MELPISELWTHWWPLPMHVDPFAFILCTLIALLFRFSCFFVAFFYLVDVLAYQLLKLRWPHVKINTYLPLQPGCNISLLLFSSSINPVNLPVVSLGFESQLDPGFFPWIYFSLNKNIVHECTFIVRDIKPLTYSVWLLIAAVFYVVPLMHTHTFWGEEQVPPWTGWDPYLGPRHTNGLIILGDKLIAGKWWCAHQRLWLTERQSSSPLSKYMTND